MIDGPDGCGKTTQQSLLANTLRNVGLEVVCCRDPGGTTIGDRIRSVLLDYDLSEMDFRCETLLFMASRAQLVAEVVRPGLARGSVVLCDRFVSSTCAYQGAAGFDPEEVVELARHAVGDCWPTLTFILDVPTEIAFRRIGRPMGQMKPSGRGQGQSALFSGAVPDAMENRSPEFHARVRENFKKLPAYYPAPIVAIDATTDPDAIHGVMLKALAQHAPP